MVVNQQQRKGRWMPDEDKLLVRLVHEHGVDGEDIDWSILEQNFNGTRDSKQIRERWVNHLNPQIKKRKFNDEEIKIIEDECSKHKFKWAKIAKKIPNATPLMIKNFYNNRLKKKNPANRRLSNASSTTTYTINDFNNTINTINNNFITKTNLNNPNINYNYCYDEYRPAQDICYYNESNLSRTSSYNTDPSTPGLTNLSRNSSVKTTSSLSTTTTIEYHSSQDNFPAASQVPLTPSHPSSEMEIHSLNKEKSADEKLFCLARVADFVSTVEPSQTDCPTKPKKAKKMSLSNILNF